MKYHKFKRLIKAEPQLMIILNSLMKVVKQKCLREFARKQLRFVAFRPKIGELNPDLLGVMGCRSSMLVGERRGDTVSLADAISVGWEVQFFSVFAQAGSEYLLGHTNVPFEKGLASDTVADLIRLFEQQEPNCSIQMIIRQIIFITMRPDTVREVSVEVFPLGMTARDCLQKYDGWYGIKAA